MGKPIVLATACAAVIGLVASCAGERPPERVACEFLPDEAQPGTVGKSILTVDGKVVAEGRIPKSQPFTLSADEGVDVGIDNETMVSDDYKPGASDFKGEIVQVTAAQK